MSLDARTDAERVAGPGARVLEPSPPAVRTEPWYADDPALGAPASVGPVPQSGGITWDDWLLDHPEQRRYVEARWLGGDPQLGPVPTDVATTRLSWHLLAAYVLSPARRGATGKIALRWTRGGVGTPFYGADDTQLRLSGDRLVVTRDGAVTRTQVTSLAAAAHLAGLDGPDLAWAADFDVPSAGDVTAPLAVETTAATWLGEWFGLGNAALEALRAASPAARETRVQLWPEHFDLAVTLPVAGADATFGVSPGDAAHPEPYLYVLPGRPVEAVEAADGWNAVGWSGALLGATEVAAAPSARAAVSAFFAGRIEALTRTEPGRG